MSSDEMMYTPDEWAPPTPEGPHDHKGYSEERCVRCGWVMGHQPLNCNNDNTPHVFPSQLAEIERLRFDCAELRDGLGRKHDYACRMGALAEERLMEATRLTAERDASRLIINDLTAEVERLRAAGDRAYEAINAVVCGWPRNEMAELAAAYVDWEARREQ